MKKSCGILLAIMLLVTPSNAQQGLSVSTTMESYSGFIWRGGRKGEVNNLVLQPGIALGFGGSGITAGVWGSFFVQKRDALEEFDEIDLYADYSRILSEKRGVGISLGYKLYLIPRSAKDDQTLSNEVYIGISLDNALSPALTFYYDFNRRNGWYLSFSAGVDVPLGSEDGRILRLDGNVAMSDYDDSEYYNYDNITVFSQSRTGSGFHDATVIASIGFVVGSVSIVPTVAVSYRVQDLYYDYYDYYNKYYESENFEDEQLSFWYGVSIGFSP